MFRFSFWLIIFGAILIITVIVIKEDIFQNLINKFFPFQAAVIETLPLEPEKKNLPETKKEITPSSEEIESEESVLEKETPLPPEIHPSEIQNNIDEITERIDLLSQELADLIEESQGLPEEPSEIAEAEEIEEAQLDEELGQEEIGQELGQEFCQKIVGTQANRNKIILNEITWLGSQNSANDEWIELKNISGQETDLTGWQILNKDQKIKIIFSKEAKLLLNGFFLLERTNDDSVPGVAADLIYTGALKNENEALYLFDANCQLQDEVLADPTWPAGDNSSKRTMERKGDLSWQTSLDPGGTPKKENSSGYSVPPTGGGGTPVPEPTTYPKILISEIQISPIESRFIELYNPNESEVNLTGWYIQRKTKTATSWASFVTSTQFEGKTIQSKSYFLISRTLENSDILLTDLTLTEDNSLVLKNPNREIVNKVGWGQAQDFETAPVINPDTGESIGRIWDQENQIYFDRDDNFSDFEIQIPTPKSENQSPVLPEDTTPPIVSFTLSSIQNTLSFTLSWTAEDLSSEGVTPSGIDGFFLQYTVTPSDIGGIQYQDENGNWQNWKENEILEIGLEQNQLTLLGKDEYSYNFKIKARDKAGNESNWAEASTEISPLKPILINEVQIAGENTDNDFIELYNPNDIELDISGYKLRKRTSTGSESSIRVFPEGSKIPARGFFLWANSQGNFHLSIEADVWSTATLAKNNSIALFNSEDLIIDALAWGSGHNNPFVEISSFPQNPEKNQSLERINFQDTDDNSQDFVLQPNPSPQNSKF